MGVRVGEEIAGVKATFPSVIIRMMLRKRIRFVFMIELLI